LMIKRHRILPCLTLSALLLASAPALAAPATGAAVMVPAGRSTLVDLPSPAGEVLVANPDIADVHIHNATRLAVIGNKHGRTNLRVMAKDGTVLREIDVTVGYDLPSLRKALKQFLPNEKISVEMMNTSVALTGQVSSAAAVDRAMQIAKEFISEPQGAGAEGGTPNAMAALAPSAAPQAAAAGAPAKDEHLLNFLQVTSGQQVMLRVRVGEIRRTALKELGIDLNILQGGEGNNLVSLGTGGGIASLVAPGAATAVSPGVFLLPGGQVPSNTRGVLGGRYQPGGVNGNTYSGLIRALEQDGLFKTLAEPNLTAISGEQAGTGSNISIEYKPFGVAVKFTPYVLGEKRIRMMVMPEVSEVSQANAININGFKVPSLETRRAKTTVELAPGESFMIAGLLNDTTRASIEQLPGAKELPVLGALFRSTAFQRNETELVIAVTPYIVDPMQSGDVKMPTDEFRPASQMEMFFYGALGATQGTQETVPQNQALEGPTGFMVD
ncbi:MAG: type II and III secretion system protein family protein, partial [Proteobacteria bacterium]|nr:type II and III secretion system protein family protein [Pseudomonadota bacterium]